MMKLFRRKDHRPGLDADRHQAVAERLRQIDPELFSQILSQTKGSAAEPVAMRDPVSFVALYLGMNEKLGYWLSPQDAERVKRVAESTVR